MSARLRGGPARAAASGHSGLSLLELLLVVTILALLAIGLVRLGSGVEQHAAQRLAEVELVRLRDALLSFRADTGYMPRTGPFALVVDDPVGRVAVPPEGVDWFRSPANRVQLVSQPIDPAGDPVLPFDPDTGRGWRGPYLGLGTEGYVTIGAGLGADGSGRPTDGALIPRVPAVADPFDHPPVGAYLQWTTLAGTPNARRGRPVLLLGIGDPTSTRLVSFGPNGVYEQGAGDDLVLFVLR